MKHNYEIPVVEIVLLDERDVIRTSGEGMTEDQNPLQPEGGNSTGW